MKNGWQPLCGPEEAAPPPVAPAYRPKKDTMEQILDEMKAIRKALENPWHTEKPTEDGYYLCHFTDGENFFDACFYRRNGAWDISRYSINPYTFEVVAWQRIEPLAEQRDETQTKPGDPKISSVRHMVEVMQAYCRGEVVQIQIPIGNGDYKWEDIGNPAWDWNDNIYRVKPVG